MIAVIDYGRGNLGSVEKAFRRVGCPAVVTQDPRAVDDAQAVVLPGDGAFHDAMRNLDALGLLPALRRALDGTRPFLGICLGYQLLFSTSEEFGEGRGLDVVPGAVRRLPPGPKIPHMGWNRIELVGSAHPFLAAAGGEGTYFYFTHSYAAPITDASVAETTHSGAFAAIVERGRVFGALDADVRGRDHDGTSRLADGERGAGVDADEGLLEHDGVRRKLLYELLDAVEDRLEAQLWAAPRRRPPAVPLHRSEAASSFVDDSPSARSSAWIDTQNFHAVTLGTGPDVPARPRPRGEVS